MRLELSSDAAPEVESVLATAIKVGPSDVYRVTSPLQLSDLMQLTDLDPRPELRVEPLSPVLSPALRDADSIFDEISAAT